MTNNPYDSPATRESSSCYKWQDKKLVHAFTGAAADLLTRHIHNLFRATVESDPFPCAGAKIAFNKNSYRFGLYTDMNGDNTQKALAYDLVNFAREQKESGSGFTTFIACFKEPGMINPEMFENETWRLLGALADMDRPHHQWDKMASDDPADPHFSFSFAGTAYFVAALSPVSSRWSRRFLLPTLVFNAHYQFEEMKKKGVFERMRDLIRKNDEKLQGAPNALADDFGNSSEAAQYCAVEKGGAKPECPFHKFFRKRGPE